MTTSNLKEQCPLDGQDFHGSSHAREDIQNKYDGDKSPDVLDASTVTSITNMRARWLVPLL